MIICLIVIGLGCTNKNNLDIPINPVEYKVEIDNWNANRVASLQSEDGWLNLAGLYWLKEGINSFGSGEMNDIIFPEGKIPARAGFFIVNKGAVNMEVRSDVNITMNSSPITRVTMFPVDSSKIVSAEYGSLRWFIIERENFFGIRLRDLESTQKFMGIERYEVDLTWRLEAILVQFAVPKIIEVANVLGRSTHQVSPGTLVFSVNGEEYKLDALDGGAEGLFVIFSDSTNSNDTYPAGRYVYVNKPDENGDTYIDFNKAHNPPCAFTPFATCPLPPKQNFLNLSVTAGEKKYAATDH